MDAAVKIIIRRANPYDASELTALSLRSKQSNGYDDVFMEACRKELTVTPEQLLDWEYWVAESETICGLVCLAIDPVGTSGEVHSFFIDPDWQRKGIGNLLWQKIIERAQTNGIPNLRLDSDPAAVPFYEKLGFKVVGEVASGSIPGRNIPHMTIVLDHL